jgi:hypothetical protein
MMANATAPGAGTASERGGALFDLAIWLAALAVVAISGNAISNLTLKPSPGTWLLPIVPMALLFFLSTWLLRRRGESWRSLGLRMPTSIVRVVGLVIAGYVSVIALNALMMLVVAPKLGIARPSFGPFLNVKGHPAIFAYWLTFALVSAALGEELQFRGFLWSRLERLFGGGRGAAVATLLVQAAMFGACHVYQGLSGILATGAAGLVLGAVYWAGGRNLVANMILHGLIDTVSLTVLFIGLAPPQLSG